MSVPKKIGILTFHRCINYGSYWQARCLADCLRSMGHDAVLLDHASRLVDRREWRCALKPQPGAGFPREDLKLNAAKTRRFFAAFGDLPRSERFALADPSILGELDIIVVGSDEVWNLRHPWYGGYPIFYGEALRANRLVSYAASFGNQAAAEPLDAYWARQLSNFEWISVRDDNSARIVKDALGSMPELVLDPCLLSPPAIEPGPAAEEPPYIAVYGHSFPAWFIAFMDDWAAREGHRLLSIGYRNDWANEQRIEAGPEAFAQLISGSAGVITNFFHGCVFALLNAKPFVCVSSDYRANKVHGLMQTVGAEQRLVSESVGLPGIARLLEKPLDKDIFQRLNQLRARSQIFLQNAIGP